MVALILLSLLFTADSVGNEDTYTAYTQYTPYTAFFLRQRYVAYTPPPKTQTYAALASPSCPIVKQCVYYVVNRTGIQISGNARDWRANAGNFGYGVYEIPRIMGVVSLATNTYYGHIAVVEEVRLDSILISEQNYEACGEVTWRVIRLDDLQILGYIY